MARRPITTHRSGCPINISLEVLGDRWSLLIVRDLMVRGFQTFRDFEHAGERIATNILSDRLRRLSLAGIVTAERDAADARQKRYRLTEKGIDLAPALLELMIWGAKHEKTGAPATAIARIARSRAAVLNETRRRWKDRDPRPLLPWLGGPRSSRGR
ncbi:MAG TPA: helix-turn-helix domain-containing protein [Gemmatimonadales bacterium]|nr:helix-turn-helix domain-containing protein [Gemmatimonadales bacterium]